MVEMEELAGRDDAAERTEHRKDSGALGLTLTDKNQSKESIRKFQVLVVIDHLNDSDSTSFSLPVSYVVLRTKLPHASDASYYDIHNPVHAVLGIPCSTSSKP